MDPLLVQLSKERERNRTCSTMHYSRKRPKESSACCCFSCPFSRQIEYIHTLAIAGVRYALNAESRDSRSRMDERGRPHQINSNASHIMGASNGVYIYMHTVHPSISVFDINKIVGSILWYRKTDCTSNSSATP